MKEMESRTYVQGTSALKPDCSRYSNENEHIIAFPGNPYAVPAEPIERGKHAGHERSQLGSFLNKLLLVKDLKSGSIRGCSRISASKGGMVAAGSVYAAMAIVALYFGA